VERTKKVWIAMINLFLGPTIFSTRYHVLKDVGWEAAALPMMLTAHYLSMLYSNDSQQQLPIRIAWEILHLNS
jgi:hypothetical protein